MGQSKTRPHQLPKNPVVPFIGFSAIDTSLFWSAFWSFSLAIGARKTLSFTLSNTGTVFLSQLEVPIGRGETVGPGALRGIRGGKRGEGEREEGVAPSTAVE